MVQRVRERRTWSTSSMIGLVSSINYSRGPSSSLMLVRTQGGSETKLALLGLLAGPFSTPAMPKSVKLILRKFTSLRFDTACVSSCFSFDTDALTLQVFWQWRSIRA